ncbi:CmcI family methyltransferase [Mycobacterium colombiense]
MNEHEKVGAECAEEVAEQGKTQELTLLSSQSISASTSARYPYHFAALGRPQDIAATIVEDLPVGAYPDHPWGHGDNPKTVVWKYLETHLEFEIDDSVDSKLLTSVAPRGFLCRKK